MYAKRFWISVTLGIVAGFICALGGNDQTPENIRSMWFISVVLNRAFIGFTIGISGWRIPWYLHGILIGFVGTMPLAMPLVITSGAGMIPFLMYAIAGIVWGFVIELVTCKVFKAPMKELAN